MIFIFNRLIAFAVVAMLLSACRSNLPPAISDPIPGEPGLAEVQAQASRYSGQKVRWGGVVVKTENRQSDSRIWMVAFPLNDWGRPRIEAPSPGRFIAIVNEFLEPLVYRPDRELTLTGNISGTETLKIGDFAYDYALVQVDNYHLWPVRVEPKYGDPLHYWPHRKYPFYRWPYHHIPYPHR